MLLPSDEFKVRRGVQKGLLPSKLNKAARRQSMNSNLNKSGGASRRNRTCNCQLLPLTNYLVYIIWKKSTFNSVFIREFKFSSRYYFAKSKDFSILSQSILKEVFLAKIYNQIKISHSQSNLIHILDVYFCCIHTLRLTSTRFSGLSRFCISDNEQISGMTLKLYL